MGLQGRGSAQHESPHDSRFLLEQRPFFALLENLPFAAYTCDAEGLISYFNEKAVEIWGRAPKLHDPADRFCGSFKLYLAEGQPIDHEHCWMARALKSEKSFLGEELIIERPDGSRLTVLAHANPLHDAEGKLTGAVNVLVDISDRKRADETQAWLASIVESSDDAIISKNLDGVIQSWNKGAERLFGWTAAEAIGQHITLIIPPDRYDEEAGIISQLRQGQRIDHFETVRMRRDGRPIHLSLTVSPVCDSSGRIIAASKVARDITARKQGDASLVALKDQLALQLADLRRLHEMSVRLSTTLELRPILEETLRTAVAVENTSMGLLSLCDADGTNLRVGSSFGFSDAFLKSVHTLPFGSGSCGSCLQQRQRVIIADTETDEPCSEYRQLARDEGFRAVHSTPLITRGGQLAGVLSTHFRHPHRPTDREAHLIDLCARQAVDYIENAQLYAALQEADRKKDEFLATLAHELRNPLAPISNSLELLKMADDLPPALQRIRDVMERQVTHMVRLVDDLLEVSRITRGKIELRLAPVELASIVGTAVETSRPLLESAGHQLAIKLPPEPISLQADAVRLAQVISNVLNNAAKYTERSGQIWLTARREGNQAVISIRDTGVGIPAEMLPRVFDVFAQSEQTLNRAQGGLGIGLALSKKLAELHGGTIEALSGGAGKGSEFIIRLPMFETASASQKAPLAGPRQKYPQRKVLIVDDTHAAAYMLSKLLEMMGQKVQAVNSAFAALERAVEEPPDVVISDIAMPEMDGYELARRLRQMPQLKGTLLVALTGYGQDADKQRTTDAGFDRHLVKPVGLETLEELLATLPHPEEASPDSYTAARS